MATIKEFNIRMGDNAIFTYPVPCILNSRTPYVTWELPLERKEEVVTVVNSYTYSYYWANDLEDGEPLVVPTNNSLFVNGMLTYKYSNEAWRHDAEENEFADLNGVTYKFIDGNFKDLSSGTILDITDTSLVLTRIVDINSDPDIVTNWKIEYKTDGTKWSTVLVPVSGLTATVTYEKTEVTYERLIQKRFNCKITAIDSSALFINGSQTTSNTYFQYPVSSPMTDNFMGLCSIELAISSNDTGEFEYTSGVKYFVFDTESETLSRRDSVVIEWVNSYDKEQTWDQLKYHLMVATDPTFVTESIVFDSYVEASDRNKTYASVRLMPNKDIYFLKVRAFDGFDYSSFTKVNGFQVTDNRPPVIVINDIIVTDNDLKDVIIDFTVEDPDNNIMSVEVYYFGGTVDENADIGGVAYMVNPLVGITNGRKEAIWRSSYNEKKIEDDYYIYMVVTDIYGLTSNATSTTFHMDNSTVGVTPSTPNALDYSFAYNGYMANKVPNYIIPLWMRLIGNYSNDYNSLKYTFRSIGYNSTWSTYVSTWLTDDTLEAYRDQTIEITPYTSKYYILKRGYYNVELLKKFEGKDYLIDISSNLDIKIDNFSYYLFTVDYYDKKENGEWEYKFSRSIRNVLEYNKLFRRLTLDGPIEFSHKDKDDLDSPIINNYALELTLTHYKKRDFYIDKKSTFSFPAGMNICVNGKPEGDDLDSADADFIVDLIHVNSEGEYQEIEGNSNQRANLNFNSNRRGYIRFLRQINGYSEELCKTCDGKGWVKEELIIDPTVPEDNPFRYKRVPCSECKGYRFVKIRLEDKGLPEKFKQFLISDYKPIDGYFSPLTMSGMIQSSKFIGFTRNAPDYVPYYLGYAVSPGNESSYKNHQRVALTHYNKTYDMYGFFDGSPFKNYYGIKVQGNLPTEHLRLIGKIAKDPLDQEELFRCIGKTFEGMKDYIPGVTHTNDVFNFRRKTPTHRWEAGMLCYKGNTTRYREASEPLQIIYLQDSWSEYNTIHWNGEISATTTYNVQYKEVNDDVWRDVIPENGFYDYTRNVWLVNANERHCYWHTINQIPFDLTKNYQIRVRQYNTLSGTFTASVTSTTTFQFAEEETNPANIFFVEYKRLSKELYIYYRLDDPNNDEYDITNVYYSPTGTDFIKISPTHLKGYFNNLTSYKVLDNGYAQPNEHRIIWDTSSYNLEPGDDYRICIEVIKSKYVSGYSLPVLSWRKDPNTFLDANKHTVEEIEGVWQYYVYDDENKTVTRLETPVFMPGTYQDLNSRVEQVRRETYPLPEYSYGYYEFLESYSVDSSDSNNIMILNGKINENIVYDGKSYSYFDWMTQANDKGETRNDRLYMLSNEFDEVTDRLFTAKEAIREDIKYTRRLLIDQGYYTNGYKNNKKENGKFVFKVLIYFDEYLDENGNYIKPYQENFGDVIYSYTTEEEGPNEEPLEVTTNIYEYTRITDVYSRIQLDQLGTYTSQNGKPMRDFLYNSSGERIISLAGGEDFLKSNMETINKENPPETSYKNPEETKTYKNVKDSFTIPTSDLPGEHETDISLWGDTFEGNYFWRVSSYNIIQSSYNEKPFIASQQYTNGEDGDINLYITMKADDDIVTANIKNIWYFDSVSNTYNLEDVTEIDFPTDVSDSAIASGDTYDFDWLPMTKDRSKPFVIRDSEHKYNMWYSRSDNYGQKIIVYAKGKCESIFGDYDTAIPFNNKPIESEFPEITNAYSPSVFLKDGIYYMYYTVLKNGENTIQLSTSTDGYKWTHSNLQGLEGNIYNPFARYKNNIVELYYCKYVDTVSVVYKSTSIDGINFSGEELFLQSENDISNIFILEHEGNDVIFYTESYEVDPNAFIPVYSYSVKNNSNGVFPTIEGAKSFCCYKEGYDYVFFYDKDKKFYTGKFRNYVKKPTSSNWNISRFVSGTLTNIPVNSKGNTISLVIRRNARYDTYGYYCDSEFRNSSSIIGFILDCEGSAKYKEYRIECPFLSAENVDQTNGEVDPKIYRYLEISKS